MAHFLKKKWKTFQLKHNSWRFVEWKHSVNFTIGVKQCGFNSYFIYLLKQLLSTLEHILLLFSFSLETEIEPSVLHFNACI